ncbi:MAG: ABC transporter ATP-binding protein [Minisyncoccia bacterium]
MSEKARKTNTEVKSSLPIPHSSMRFILYVFAQYRWAAFGAISVVVLAASLGQASSYFFKLIIDASESGNTERVFFYALLYPIILLIVQLLYRLSGLMGKILTTGSRKYANDILVEYLLQHSHKYFSDRFAGSLLSKVNNVVGAIEQFVPDLLWTHITAIVSFVLTAVFIGSADVLSGVLFVVLIIVLIVTNRLFARKKKILSYRASELSTKLRGIIVDIFSNISATRQYVRTNDEMDRVRVASEEQRQAGSLSWGFTELMLLVNTGILFVFSFGIFYLLVARWNAGSIGTGDFVLILALYSQITGTLLFIGRAFNNTARSFGEIEEGLAEILQPYEIVDSEDSPILSLTEGKIEWKNVSFDYGEREVFTHFDLTIQSGQRIGLVGSSGAGKSTFVSLLLRQHELMGGEIEIDAQNIAQVTQDSLRENIAVVPQEPMLFHRSIRENIAYGKPDATEAEIISVAKKAEAHDFIMSLKEGYDTLVGERGVKLSGGQKQRVAIARAMLKDAPVLVLDEATSALDSESEVAIQKALHTLMEGKTVIAIAHRLSTLREMDRIIVLENGKIAEDGTHETLSKAGGTYSRLWEHQAGGFLQE